VSLEKDEPWQKPRGVGRDVEERPRWPRLLGPEHAAVLVGVERDHGAAADVELPRRLHADLRVRLHCRFRNRGTKYVSDSVIKWASGGAKRQCDLALADLFHVQVARRDVDQRLHRHRRLAYKRAVGAVLSFSIFFFCPYTDSPHGFSYEREWGEGKSSVC
jgi:hypothetical protein